MQKTDFIKKMLNRPIVFVGLMGAGKTSLGQALAKKLDIGFVDSDHLIEEREGCTIAELFANKGEAYFRECERHTILGVAAQKDIKVIGTGGGAFMNDITRQVIQEKTLSVFLNADFDVLRQRIGDGHSRPLLKNNPDDVLRQLINERYSIYKQAHISVSSYDEPLEETLKRVIEMLYTHLSDR